MAALFSLFPKERCVHVLPEQHTHRRQPGQHLRHHRPGLYHGLRHCQDAQLCPRGCYHGGRFYVFLCHRQVRPSPPGKRAAGRGGLHRPGHHHRGAGLQAPAGGTLPGGAHHRHRRQLPAPERGPAAVGGGYQNLHPHCVRLPFPGRRAAEYLLCLPAGDGLLPGGDGLPYLLHQPHPDGQGHAGLLRG